MSQNRSLFAVPCYYTGTSFERIYAAITHVIKENKLPIDIMAGACFDNILTGGVLDDTRYTQAQANMISSIVSKLSVQEYDRILFIDFFNPGMELIRYFAEQTGRHINMAALLHGGTFVEGDIFEAEWVMYSEQLWGSLFDKVFVPSRYAYSQLPAYLENKASIRSWGMDGIASGRPMKPYNQREIDVIFPHRLNNDKGISDLADIARQLPFVDFTVTSPSSVGGAVPAALENLENIRYVTCVSTDDLQEVMRNAKIVLSCAKQELFGYSVAEAVSMGCLPVVPNNQVYAELYSENSLYRTIDDACSLIARRLSSSQQAPQGKVQTSFLPLLQEFMEMK